MISSQIVHVINMDQFHSFSAGLITLINTNGNATLDFETVTQYLIEVAVADPLHTVTATVTVIIDDVNEAPYFTTTYYEDTLDDTHVSINFLVNSHCSRINYDFDTFYEKNT